MTAQTVLLLLAAGGMETALLVTSLVTVFAIVLILLAVFMPPKDREEIAASWKRTKQYLLTGNRERVALFDHDFDGIQELDNRIPPWFSTLFLGTALFAGIYLLTYHVFRSAPLMEEEYQQEVADADLHRRILLAAEGVIDEATLAMLNDPEALKRGGDNFQRYCVSCHGAQGQGVVGPNLTDAYWIHGGGVKDVYRTIKQGVPAKGMISWQLVFSPKQIQEMASFILSLQGTNPPGGKKPEGDLYMAADSAAAQPL
jgi:cytochrome c oxidase cbb3-type subunit 3